MSNHEFDGFSKESVQFYTDLKSNNNKAWFEAHKADFDKQVMTPAKDFIVAIGESLKAIAPGIHADPRVNKSIFRIYRDTRFSKDKTPYKTHLALLFWQGKRAKFECPGYYFHMEPPNLMLGAGIHTFTKPLLQAYRESLNKSEHAIRLAAAVEAVAKYDDYNVGGKHYKRVPRGNDPEHPYAELLLYNGLTVGIETEIPEAFYSRELVNYCLERYQDMSPIVEWLSEMTERVPD